MTHKCVPGGFLLLPEFFLLFEFAVLFPDATTNPLTAVDTFGMSKFVQCVNQGSVVLSKTDAERCAHIIASKSASLILSSLYLHLYVSSCIKLCRFSDCQNGFFSFSW